MTAFCFTRWRISEVCGRNIWFQSQSIPNARRVFSRNLNYVSDHWSQTSRILDGCVPLQWILWSVFYRRLHLPVNALAQNMFSCDVKRLSFSCQTFKFSRPKVKFYFSTLLKGKMILINKKGRNYRKGVPISTICRIKWKNLSRIILSQKLGED